jgi:hypothetical protein
VQQHQVDLTNFSTDVVLLLFVLHCAEPPLLSVLLCCFHPLLIVMR